jgi:hypothetical protein
VKYPFEPKSNAHLEAGQFWAIPLSNGRFACGRVLDVPREPDPAFPVSSRIFLAGLLDWSASEPPTGESIAGVRLLEQGFAHILAIRTTGRLVLGCRPLELDGLTPYHWLSASVIGRDTWVYEGARRLRPADKADAGMPVLGVWGYGVIGRLAEFAFGDPRAAKGP